MVRAWTEMCLEHQEHPGRTKTPEGLNCVDILNMAAVIFNFSVCGDRKGSTAHWEWNISRTLGLNPGSYSICERRAFPIYNEKPPLLKTSPSKDEAP
eukprot:6430392-Amphidinium_carterae.1